MNTLNSLLVIIDPTVDRDFVVDRAKLVARATNAKVRLFINNSNTLSKHSYIYEGINGQFFETQSRLFESHYKKMLEHLVEEFNAENFDVSSEFTEEHHLAESIIRQAEEFKPDLVMKSTHHHSIIERSLVTNTDWRLIRKCPTPLLLVKPDPWQEGGSIVAAVDPLHTKSDQTKLDHILLTSTEFFANKLDQTPCVFHSYFPFVSTMFPMGGESKKHLERIRDQHGEKLKELLAGHSIAIENIQLSEGDLVPTLIKYLKSVKTNILAIGALSRNVLERAIVGNTAEKILEYCPCDVLILKS